MIPVMSNPMRNRCGLRALGLQSTRRWMLGMSVNSESRGIGMARAPINARLRRFGGGGGAMRSHNIGDVGAWGQKTEFGGSGRNRTDTSLRTLDFESSASTNSTTEPFQGVLRPTHKTKTPPFVQGKISGDVTGVVTFQAAPVGPPPRAL